MIAKFKVTEGMRVLAKKNLWGTRGKRPHVYKGNITEQAAAKWLDVSWDPSDTPRLWDIQDNSNVRYEVKSCWDVGYQKWYPWKGIRKAKWVIFCKVNKRFSYVKIMAILPMDIVMKFVRKCPNPKFKGQVIMQSDVENWWKENKNSKKIKKFLK